MRFLILLIVPVFMFAHSISVTSSYEDGELFIESFFGDGTPCSRCEFTILNEKKEVYRDKLLDDGSFEEKVKLQTPFDVHIDGGMGHWADVNIEGDEISPPPKSITNENNNVTNINEAQIRTIIRSELAKQNAKIEVMIEKNKSNLEKILVGLGYILGIFGLWQLIAQRVQK